MTYSIHLSPEAIEDIKEVKEYLNKINPDLSYKFAAELDYYTDTISENPLLFNPIKKDIPEGGDENL